MSIRFSLREIDRIAYRAASTGLTIMPLDECDRLRISDLIVFESERNQFICYGVQIVGKRYIAGVELVMAEKREWRNSKQTVHAGLIAVTADHFVQLRSRWDALVFRVDERNPVVFLLGTPSRPPGWRSSMYDTIQRAVGAATEIKNG